MRACPTCHTEYPDGVAVCARDGDTLTVVTDQAAPVSGRAAGGAETRFEAPSSQKSPLGTGPGAAFAATSALATTVTLANAVAVSPTTALPENFDSLVGATLAGRYLIIRRIGEGGMGAVYEARHTIIGKRVAVKVLLEKFLTKSDFVARLLQEARLASAIGHEHIVDVTDFGTTDDGRAFVAMEFLDGESLAQLVMREAPLPVERSLRITRQVASALGAAHAKGIVHRDVKPENVYLIRRGDTDFVKVVDFGISKAVKQGQGDDTPDYRLTHTGLLLGTPLYMSPEQARGDEDLDHRVDVWAMGVMMYECLTGEVPFRANNYLGIISQVLTHTAMPPSKLRPELGIPEAVEAVVMRAMEKDRNRRYALMSEVEHDLDRLLAGDQNVGAGPVTRPATVPPASDPARSRVWVWGAAVAALVGGVAMVLARPGEPRDVSAPPPSAAAAAASPSLAPPPPVGAAAAVPTPSAAAPPGVQPADLPEAELGGLGKTTAAASAPSAVTGGEGVASPSETSERTSPAMRGALPGRGDSHTTAGATSRETKRPRRGTLAGSATSPGRRADDPPKFGEAGLSRSPDRATPKPTNPVIRGALPSRSGEGYPDN